MLKFIRNEANEKKILFILFLITFFINISFITESKMIYMTGDEMGPIATAAYFAGADWSSVVQNIGYYSYGYALLLYPLFLIADTAVGFYRLAIVLNAIFSALIVLVSYSVGKKICAYTKRENLYMASFVVANFIANIGRSQSAWGEMLLIFLYWCIVLNFVILEEKINYKRVIVGACLSIYSYAVHQRTVGIVAVFALFFLLLCIVKKYKIQYAFCYYGVCAFLLCIHGNIKQNVQINVWLSGGELTGNDYGGVLDRLLSQNALSFLEHLMYTFCGQFFYVFVATLGLGLIAVIILIKKNWRVVKGIVRREAFGEKINISYLFVLFSFIATLAISILFMTIDSWDKYTRSDPLIYGRYIETVLGILVYMGVLYLLEEIRNKYYLFWVYGLTLVTTIVAVIGYKNIDGLPFMRINCIGLRFFMEDGKVDFWISMFIVWIVMTLLYLGHSEKRKMIYIGGISVFWIVSGLLYLKQSVIPIENEYYKYSDLTEAKWKMNENAKIYYCRGEDINILSCVQFLLFDRQNMVQIEEFSEVSDEVFYGVTSDTTLLLEHNEWAVVEQVNGAYLFTNEFKNQTEGFRLQNSMFYSMVDMERDADSAFSNNGVEGFLMYGPYISLEAGNYQVAIDYSAMGNGQLGYVDVYSGTTQAVYAQQNMSSTEGNINTVYLDFSLEELTNGIEVQAYTYAGSQVSIENVTIYKIDE